MKNPLNKRIPKELKQDFGKYFVIFAFMVMLIGLVSGFLVSANSIIVSYDEGIEKYKMENIIIRINGQHRKYGKNNGRRSPKTCKSY